MLGDEVLRRRRGEVFLDARAPERALRLTWHHDQGLVVFSLWRGDVDGTTCTGTFQLPVEDVPRLVQALVEGLAASAEEARDAAPPGWAHAG